MGVIRNYHRRVVDPLMARQLPLFKVTVETLLEGTQLSTLPSPVTWRSLAGLQRPWKFAEAWMGLSSHMFSQFQVAL
jgi:hypothetical protein